MKRLSKDQIATRADLLKRLREAEENVVPAIEAANAAIEAYNAVLGDVETWRDEIVGDMDSYYDERSDKWRDGEAGSDYADWKGGFEDLDMSAVDTIEVPDIDLPDKLEELADEPGAI